jgi:hypothetical protein
MKMTIRTVLLTLTLLGGCLMGQAQTPRTEANGWKLILVTYKEEPSTEKSDKEYGEPSVAFFVKDAPYYVNRKYRSLLVISLSKEVTIRGPYKGTRKTLMEFDCERRLAHTVRWYMSDGSEREVSLADLRSWRDIVPKTVLEDLLKYACRPKTSPKQ